MEGRHKVRGVDVISWFPCVMCFGVSFPPDSILEFLVASKMPHTYNTFHFSFFFSIDKVRRGFWKVTAIFLYLLIW
jgi:hypothetical protein